MERLTYFLFSMFFFFFFLFLCAVLFCSPSPLSPPSASSAMRAARVLSAAAGLALMMLLMAVSAVSAQSVCGPPGYDFSSISFRDLQGTDGGSEYAYYLRVCGPLKSAATAWCSIPGEHEASACQVRVNPPVPRVASNTGSWRSPPAGWSYIEPEQPQIGVQYQLVGAQECWGEGEKTDFYSNVQFVCAKTQGNLTVEYNPQDFWSACTLNYTLPTPLACPPPAPTCWGSIHGVTYDFSTLTLADFTYSFDDESVYSLRLCGAATSQSLCTSLLSPQTSACWSDGYVDPGQAKDLGHESTDAALPLDYIDTNQPALGVTYQLTAGASTCPNGNSTVPAVSNINLVCAQTQGSLTVQMMGGCVFNWTIPTPAACGSNFKLKDVRQKISAPKIAVE